MKSPRRKKKLELGYNDKSLSFFLESVLFQFFFMIISFHLTKCLFTTCFTLKVACGMILNNTDVVKGLYQASGKMLFVLQHDIFTSTEYFSVLFL